MATSTVSPLSEPDRQRLDGIVQQMTTNGETPDTISAVVNDFKQKYGSAAPATQPSAASRAAGSFWDATIGGIADTLKRYAWEPSKRTLEAAANGDWHEVVKEGLQAAMPTAAMGFDVGQGSVQQGQQAIQQAKAGQYGQAAISAVGAVPVVGPMIAKPARQFAQGDIAGGLGTTAGTAAMMLAPEAAGRFLPKEVPVIPKLARLDPAEASAVQFGESQGIPMTAATRTNNPIVKGTQKLATVVPFSGSGKALAAEQEGLAAAGDTLLDQAHPATTTPELAGGGVRTALEGRVQKLANAARQNYDKLAQVEADPANVKTVQTGTKQVTVPDANGNPQTITQPVTEQIGMPVDMRPVKAGLQDLYDSLKKELPVAKQQSSYGLKAIENIMDGPDFTAASTADQNLSAIKAIQREGVTAKSSYLAKKAIDQFSPAVDKAVADAGPQATQALSDARNLWKAKVATEDTMANLNTEPVKLVNQLTARQDAGINLLRDVASKAPDAMPAVGRAYLEGMMEKAFKEAGQAKPGSVLSEWQKLGDSTKQILFKDPRLRANLDDFFTLAKKAAENVNPSGTGPINALHAYFGAEGALALTHPLTGVPYLISRTALARMLMSQGGAKILADGLRIPVRNPAAASMAAARILNLAGSGATAGQPNQ